MNNIFSQLYASFVPTFEGIDTLPGFIKEIFTFAVAVVGLAVFIQFIRAGMTYLLAAGNTHKTGEAKEMMTNAVVGTILLMSSVIILNVINPDLTANYFDPPGPYIGGPQITPNPTPTILLDLGQNRKNNLESSGIKTAPGTGDTYASKSRSNTETMNDSSSDYLIAIAQLCSCGGTIIDVSGANRSRFSNGVDVSFVGQEDTKNLMIFSADERYTEYIVSLDKASVTLKSDVSLRSAYIDNSQEGTTVMYVRAPEGWYVYFF